jgi:hypothetical protein
LGQVPSVNLRHWMIINWISKCTVSSYLPVGRPQPFNFSQMEQYQLVWYSSMVEM